MQFTRIAERPVEIPDLPDDLEAFPVYRIRTTAAGTERAPELLRLELRSARHGAQTEGTLHLQNVEARTRAWLVKAKSGSAKTILARVGDQAIKTLYQWCAEGILVLTVDPPVGPRAPHGNLIGWRLTDPVLEATQSALAVEAERHSNLLDDASALATRLQNLPNGSVLAQTLIQTKEPDYLRHAIAVARGELDGQPNDDAPNLNADATPWRPVQQLARGVHRDYQLGPDRIVGGQAYVYPAQHKATRTPVAFKRLKLRSPDGIARMRREIEAGRLFGAHPHVMPILDADPDHGWFVMPLVTANARSRASDLRANQALYAFVTAVCEALDEPHRQGWIHRDLKPENILLLNDCWVVADWGLARRPRGATSEPGRTRTGTGYGTEGFAAPELALDAHRAGPPADIYGLGQIIGSVLTGQQPQANIPLLPSADHPWSRVVARATRLDPADRHQTTTELLDDLNIHNKVMKETADGPHHA